MTATRPRFYWHGWFVWLIPGVTLFFLGLPLLAAVGQHQARAQAWQALGSAWAPVLMVNWGNAFVASTIIVVLATGFAFLCHIQRPLPPFIATTLLLPVGLGSYGYAFFARTIYDHQPALQRIVGDAPHCPPTAVFILLAVIQHAPLVALVLMAGRPNADINDLAKVHQLNLAERFRDCFWPQVRNPVALMAAVTFFFIVNGPHAFERIIKPAPGKNYETAASWIFREFYGADRSGLTAAPAFGQLIAALTSFGTLLCGLLVAALIPQLAKAFGTLVHRLIRRAKPDSLGLTVIRHALALFFVACALLPLSGLLHLGIGPTILKIPPRLAEASIYSFFAGLLLYGGAAVWALSVRCRWPDLDSYHARGPMLLAILVGTLALQPVLVFFSASHWVTLLPDSVRVTALQALWLIGIGALNWPVLAAFQLVTMTAVRADEFHFHRVHRSTFSESFWAVLFRRFPESTALALLFGFLFAWFDVSLNDAFHNAVPSLATVQEALMGARQLDPNATARLAAWMLVPVMVALLLFRRLLGRKPEALS